MPSYTPEANTAALLRRVARRIVPLLVLLYFLAYLDRVNIGFAASAMQRDLHFSSALYGTGAGLFFLGTLIAQVPSNLLLARIGARYIIAILMVTWGLVSGSMAFVHSAHSFLALRLLLGVAEAGFYPGVIFYLSTWLPKRVRASAIGVFLFAIPLASIVGGPLSTSILEHGSHGRFADWQVLLLLEALPAVLLGALVPFFMADTPQQARWLSIAERGALLATLQADTDAPSSEATAHTPRITASLAAHIARFAAIYFTMQFGLYTQNFFLPKILHDIGQPQRLIGWQVSAVSVLSAIGMILWSRVVDRHPTARWTLTAPLLWAAAGYLAASIFVHTPHATVLLLISFGVAAAGALAATMSVWMQVSERQAAATLALTIACVNGLGNLGGFAGPSLIGKLQDLFGGYTAGLTIAAASLLLGAVLQLTRPKAQPPNPTAQPTDPTAVSA
jgi:ACS family tartrate transporter-like MFS transporter